MNFLVYLIAVIIIGVGITLFVRKTISKKLSVTLCIVGLVVGILGSSFKIIPTGYTGVRTTFGQIDNVVVQNGFNTKIPFIQSISKVNNKQQDQKFKGRIWGEASDKTVVWADDVIVTYQINPESSVYIYANVNDYKKNLIPQTLVNSSVKAATVSLSSENVTNRTYIEPATKAALENAIREKYGSNAVLISKITIDSMDFEDNYNQAIANKQIAKQQAEQQAIENQKAIELAKSQKEKAEVEAETKKIQAQADADAMLISAQAEAETYRIKSEEITDNLLKKWELDARQRHGWVTIQGANTIVTDGN